MITLIQHFEADFLWKVSLKILNSGKILKTFIHELFYILPLEAMILARYNQELMVSGLVPVKVRLVVSFFLFFCLPY